MPIVFIHGVPDTYRLWDNVRSHLYNTHSVALALPGFGAPIPEGFWPDKENYLRWIIDKLEQFGTRVDLVGHDWGGMFALRVGSLRPDLINSVAAGNGPVSSNYEWHHLAKIWQMEKDGETFMAELTREAMSAMLESLSVPRLDAQSAAERMDDQMKRCILTLYRSANNVGAEWQDDLKRLAHPAAIFWGRKDTECPVRFAYELEVRLPDSHVVEFDCGHWVPLEKPAELASLLQEHWRRVAFSSRK